MEKLGKELDLDINRCLSEIGQYVWPGFNPDSTVDMRKLLFEGKRKGGLGLKPKKVSEKTQAPSVDADTLRSFKGEHPVIDHLLEYSEVKKLKGTYIDGSIPLLHNGRLHPQFHLHRTDTGRFSSSDPNLQNIPRDDRLRALYVAEKGHSLIVADYDQIELRIMAMFSQDPVMMHIFQNDIDVHAGTASVILGKPVEEVTKEERTVYGKVPNFLMGYGGGPKRLVEASEGKITLERAQEVIEQYDAGYQVFTDWKATQIRLAKKRGFVETMGGRRRRLPEINADRSTREGWRKATGAERQAINAIIQGTAAEICKDAMITLDQRLGDQCKMLIQVHDELVVSVPTDELSHWVPVVEQSMGNGTTLQGVPLNVTAHFAGSWDQAKG
jgi:DNA polymerase-1